MKRISTTLAVAVAAVILPGIALEGVAADPAGGLAVSGLTVEHLVDPLGIDSEHPLLGWRLESSTAGDRQTAYEVEVSTDPGFVEDVWNTGKVGSAESADVEYAGDPLASQTQYHWRVRVWDDQGAVSGWSPGAIFETAFIDQADFGGDWIGSPNRMPNSTLTGANWIWFPGGDPASSTAGGKRYLRKTFTLPAGADIDAAQVMVTADDYFTLYVNGQRALASPTSGEAWRTIRVLDIGAHLHEGENVLAIEAENAGAGAAGVVGRLGVQLAGGDTVDVVTDTSWKAADALLNGWETTSFDDSSWVPAQIGAAYGSGPWGNWANAPVPPEPLLRRDFAVDKEVASARAHVAGLGYYKLYLNGDRVGDHELDPGFTVYDDTVLYSTFDVTDAIRGGSNALGVSLGRGYFGQMQPDEWVSSPWHDDPKLKLELVIDYTDGTSSRVVSDDGWTAADGPTTSESVWFGESYDARLEQPGWNTSDFDDSSWRPVVEVAGPGGELRSQLFPAVEVTDDLPVVATTNPSATQTVYDFGVPTAGWAKIAVTGPAGAQVTMKYGEKLHADGTVNNDNVYWTVQNYTYTLRGEGTETFQPSYSYAGFRYFQVTAPAGVEVTSVTGHRVHSAVDRVGDFSSSSDLLDKYDEAQADTILNNLHSVITDTPMYEKRPYTADGFLAADSAIAMFDMQNFLENWARAHRDDQSANGTFGNTVPGTVGGKNTTDPLWSSSFVETNWDLYTYYGNRRALVDNYAGMKAWMDHYEADIAETGGIYTGFSYGDWLSPAGAQAPEGTRLIATAYLYREATLMSQIAGVLGHDGDADHFDGLATTIAADFNETFYDAEKGAYFDNVDAGYRQTSNILPLRFGLVPEQHEAAVLQNLVDDIVTRDNHLNTGAIGTKELLPVLTENGYAELAYTVATNPTYPGWGYWFEELGAQTMWEEWGEHSRSHNHAFLGTVVDWQYQHVAGIQPIEPGYRKVKIQPYPIAGLADAQAHVQSPYGTITSSWTRNEDSYALDVEVPVGSTAEVHVPVGPGEKVTSVPVVPSGSVAAAADGFQVFSVGSGHHRFVVAEDTALLPTTVTAAATAFAYGDSGSVEVQVSASGTTPTGTVTVRNGADVIGSGLVTPTGRTSVTVPARALSAGQHSLQVAYSGDATHAPASGAATVTVTPVQTEIRASATKRSYKRSQTPVIKVKVKPGSDVDGTVTVRFRGRVLKAEVRLVKGRALIRLPKAPSRRGSYRVKVVYAGGPNTAADVTHVRYRIR